MENQTSTNNNSKKKLAVIVALIVIALAVVAVVVGRNQQGADAEVTEAPVVTEEITEAPTEEPTEEATDEPEATEEPAADEGEEPAGEEPDEEEPAEETTDEPEAADTSAEANPEDVMALVNGTAVTRAEIENYKASLINYFSQQGYDMTNEDNLLVVGGIALDTAVEDTILAQKIIDLGLAPTDEELAQVQAENAAEWAEAVDWYAQAYAGLTADSTEEEAADARLNALALLETMGYTESVMLESAIESMRFEKIYAYMVKDAEVTDADIQAVFEEHVAEDRASYENDIGYYEFMTQYYGYPSYYTPSGYRGVTHILLQVDEALLNEWQSLTARFEEQQDEEEPVDTDAEAAEDEEAEAEPTAEPVTQEQVDAAYAAILASVQPTIDEIYAKLEEGTPFADLVAEYGTDPGMTVEPTMTEGYAVHMDSIVWDPVFVSGAFSVDEVGEVAQPVVGSYGVHIIQYTREIPAGPVELTEEIKAELSDEVLGNKESELYRQTMTTWLEEAEIVYSDEAQAILADSRGSEE